MKVLFWVPYPKEGASNRYRVDQFLPALAAAGIKYEVRSFWSAAAFRILYARGNYIKKTFFFISGTISRALDMLAISRYDLVFIHREAYPVGGAFLERTLHYLGKPFVFDFDDAIFHPDSSRSNYFVRKLKRHNKVSRIVSMSRAVLAGNNYLADYARKYNKAVHVVPTVIDTDRCRIKEVKETGAITIGWIGSVTTIDFLKPMETVFIRLIDKYKDLRLKIVGGNSPFANLPNTEVRPWALAGEMEEIFSFDIGIMPIPDDTWTRGKCGFKAILYMSMGIPCVCSAVGTNKDIISDGKNGFLASTDDEWFDKLSRLIDDRVLRKAIGAAGRKTVEERYSLKVYSDRFIKILKGA